MQKSKEAIRAQAVLDRASLPDWVVRVVVSDYLDQDDDPALRVLVVLSADVVTDGDMLNELMLRIHHLVWDDGVELYPYVDYVGSDEIDAA